MLGLTLLIIGGMNWLLVGLFKWDVVGGLTGGMDSMFARIVYVIIGLAAIYSFSLYGRIDEENNTSENSAEAHN
jgi:uncharacterized membrane protein YuzA (DUF378 family)